MPEEIFDVVNARDEAIDCKQRGEAHRLGPRHRAVNVLVFNMREEDVVPPRNCILNLSTLE